MDAFRRIAAGMCAAQVAMESQNQSSRAIDAGVTGARPLGRRMLRLFRWLLMTREFLFLLAAILVGGSLLASFYMDAWHWFQRSGALMVSIGAILSTRRPLGLMLERMTGDIAQVARTQTDASSYLSDAGELRTCVCGFLFVAVGTLIWAYGDLLGCLVHWDASCLN